ncbi:MAG: hypothetical protein EZS28_015749 [Streblomastix strix]|uniref:Uncharacterized protein n=1 Tax=Streblomastix strix TaxID=222440 RepID=A0A5J4W239_9EUKA|nr:MAG: hypothetical protein EZS28_015749 [Streblomastix strix]
MHCPTMKETLRKAIIREYPKLGAERRMTVVMSTIATNPCPNFSLKFAIKNTFSWCFSQRKRLYDDEFYISATILYKNSQNNDVFHNQSVYMR